MIQWREKEQVSGVKKPKMSLKMGLMATIVVCWLLPIAIVVTLAGVLLTSSYTRSVRQGLDASANNGLGLVRMQLEDAVSDSKAVSYDGVVRAAYTAWLQSGDSAVLYGAVNDYLSQNFTREELYKAVFITFWDADADAYVLSQGATNYSLLRQCQTSARQIVEQMADADTDIRMLFLDGQLYMARNLLDSTFTPYASVVMMMDLSDLLRPLDAVSRISDISYVIDGQPFRLAEDGSVTLLEAEPEGDVRYEVEAEGHQAAFSAVLEPADLWRDMPWLQGTIAGAALLVLPLLVLMIVLFTRHVTRPVETLAQANRLVQSGQRGYEIVQTPPNAEFASLYGHFNDMSAELKRQFERLYLEQQATQRAQIKALQSQINPHFLNNTLETINWEARMAGSERVSAMIEALSTMLNAALDRDGRTQIPFSEEMGYVDAYLYIIHERLGDGFRVRKQIDAAVLDQLIPRLILQPIVENAVEHDITARRGGQLCVRAFRRDGRMVLEVEHDGTMTAEDQENIRKLLGGPGPDGPGGPVGLRNVHQRLKLIYGEAGLLTVTETAPGTILARVEFPVTPAEGEKPILNKKGQEKTSL